MTASPDFAEWLKQVDETQIDALDMWNWMRGLANLAAQQHEALVKLSERRFTDALIDGNAALQAADQFREKYDDI